MTDRTAVRCSATTKTGKPCRAYALHGSKPPLCSAHSGCNEGAGAPPRNQNANQHGFYGRAYSVEELADLIAHAANMTLDDEIAAVRVGIQRAMLRISDGRTTDTDAEGYELERDLTPVEIANLTGLLFTGANTVARLLRARRAIGGEAADGIAGAIAQALDELSTELGIEL